MRGVGLCMCLLIVVPQCLVLWEELPLLITSHSSRLTDPLTLSLDNLLHPDIANKPGWVDSGENTKEAQLWNKNMFCISTMLVVSLLIEAKKPWKILMEKKQRQRIGRAPAPPGARARSNFCPFALTVKPQLSFS